jgi:tetratricopeptide (TPR) repeat protein
MSQLQDRIAQFRKMANDDPDNELGHYRLGQLLMEDGQFEEALKSFRRTLELSPQFSKVYQLLGNCLVKLGKKDEAVQTLTEGFHVAEERGDNLPRDEMVKMLTALEAPIPASKKPARAASAGGEGDGFRCQRPGCFSGSRARKLDKPPFSGELGDKIHALVCADCWTYWLRDLSVKVINEMRLDLSTEQGADTYDQIMRETLGLS